MAVFANFTGSPVILIQKPVPWLANLLTLEVLRQARTPPPCKTTSGADNGFMAIVGFDALDQISLDFDELVLFLASLFLFVLWLNIQILPLLQALN